MKKQEITYNIDDILDAVVTNDVAGQELFCHMLKGALDDGLVVVGEYRFVNADPVRQFITSDSKELRKWLLSSGVEASVLNAVHL